VVCDIRVYEGIVLLNLNLLGLGDRGQLGLGSRVLTAETFESVPNLPKRLLAIAAGEAHTVVLGARGDMYVFGDGKHGKLGPATHSNEFEPCSVEKFKNYNVTKVVCGGCQTIVLAQKKASDEKKASESDEDIGSMFLIFTTKQKS
jgi:alpha-tubulin suppressor-like RCC1 family protein